MIHANPPLARRAGLAVTLLAAGLLALVACSDDSPAVSADADRDTSTSPGDVDPEDATDTAELDDTELDDTGPTDTASSPDTGSPPDTSPQDTGPTDTAGPTNGYPAADDLVIRIIEPGGEGSAAAVGSIVRLAGVLFGEADSIVWQRADQNGAIALGPFWQSGPIELSPGDNRITVTASRGDRFVTNSVVVTYNPAFRFDNVLTARPQVLWVGHATNVIFTIPNSLYVNSNQSTLRLLRVDANGNQLQNVGAMRDDGALNTSGDEIEGDGVFTLRTSLTCTSAEPLFFRASVEVTGSPSYTAVSPTIQIDCVERLTVASCTAHKEIIDGAAASLEAGVPIDTVVADLAGHESVKAAGRGAGESYSAWVQFDDGILGAVLGTPAGKRGAGADGAAAEAFSGGSGFGHLAAVAGNVIDVGSKRAIVLAPFAAEFGATDDGVDVANAIVSTECPAYDLEGGTVLQGANASLARFRNLSTYGVASISTHGDALFGGVAGEDARGVYRWAHVGPQEVLWTGSAVNCAQLIQTNQNCTVSNSNPTGGCPAGTRCLVTQGTVSETEASGNGICLDETQVDLRLGRVVLTNRGYAVTPSFFSAHRSRGYPQSLVNLGACRTMYNGTLASTLFAAGARAITGFSGYVESAWARERVVELFSGFGSEGLLGERHFGGEDPDNPGSHWRFFGATNLNLANAELINGSFETGDTVGWTAQGDGRVVAQLGSTGTVDGKFMGLISTGLGFTLETGTLEQTFCIPADKVLLELYWMFFSEEFKEFCGSQYQDTFQAVLLGLGGQLTLVDVRVDDLCGYQDGSCGSCPNPTPCDLACAGQSGCRVPEGGGACVGAYNCKCGKYYVGLTPSDISFDQGGVFNILWQRMVKNVQALAGTGPVTLRLYATDTGDSVFDTAILIDAIKFK